MTDHHQELTAAVKEVLSLLDTARHDEVSSILRDALEQYGHKLRTAVPGEPVVVGVCSRCNDGVVREPGRGARCPCGDTILPESFIARMPDAA